MKNTEYTCPNCKHVGMLEFYTVEQVPIHSVLLHFSREEALRLPTGRIELGYCPTCSFVSNMTFDPEVMRYAGRYESTQAYSPTFGRFHRQLAQYLIERYDLQGKRLLEIGCGQGEFLKLLCELGHNTGIGFDPAYDANRADSPSLPGITFVADYYSEQYADYGCDFLYCKMTLEHIPETADFVSTVRRAIGDRRDTTVFFQVPNADYVFRDRAFWDIYYEHCSYFNADSLAYVFQNEGFEVLNLWTGYDDQYLMIEARPCEQKQLVERTSTDVNEFAAHVTSFEVEGQDTREHWKAVVAQRKAAGKRLVLWGGGSKAVSFLTTLDLTEKEIDYVVDINPHKANTYLAHTAHQVRPPESVTEEPPGTVIIMNPVYRDEIRTTLERFGQYPELMTV